MRRHKHSGRVQLQEQILEGDQSTDLASERVVERTPAQVLCILAFARVSSDLLHKEFYFQQRPYFVIHASACVSSH